MGKGQRRTSLLKREKNHFISSESETPGKHGGKSWWIAAFFGGLNVAIKLQQKSMCEKSLLLNPCSHWRWSQNVHLIRWVGAT